jgi:hypothetical protein
MNILAIDPGTMQSGWVLFDGARVIQSGTSPNDEVLMACYSQAAGQAQCLAIEEPEGMGQIASHALLRAAWAGGGFERAWPRLARSPLRITRRMVVAELLRPATVKGKSQDSRIRQALIDRVGEPGTKRAPGPTYGVSSHAWSALAVAVVAWGQLHVPRETVTVPLLRAVA